MIKDYFIIPWKEIKRRKLRSWLTLIGIIIGIAAVISLITLGKGLENAIAKQFDALGNDKLFITAKGSPLTPGLSTDAVTITNKDVDIVKRSSSVKEVAAMSFTTARIEFNDRVRYFIISGLPTDPKERALLGEAQSYKINIGRSLDKGDKYKAVLGYEYTKQGLFDKEITVGDKILINNQEFKVIGFMDRIGSPPDDQSILIPFDTYSDLFNTDEEVGFIVAQVKAGEDIEKAGEDIKKDLRKERGLSEGKEDFSVETPDKLASAFGTILDIVNIVLVGIAAISLLVGGIGIMNTMFTSVLQRTKEIGVMKALGAQNKHILYLFLIESGFYGLGGGLIGITIGIGLAKLVEAIFIIYIGPAFLLIEIDYYLILGTLLFSFIVGCLSGIAPARRASKLNPVDSLRYE
jgi:putative ABC transport system permease protein